MASVPDYYRSRTSLEFAIDTNTVDDMSAPMVDLRERHRDGWVNLTRTDTLDTELGGASDDRRASLLKQSRPYVEHFGPMILDHSRLDACVLGTADDEDRFKQVFGILFPGANRQTARRNHIRDAHVATAIRYGRTGFITNDEGLLKRDEAIRAAFDSFRILSPRAALVLTERQIAKHEDLAGRDRGRPR